MCKKVSGKKFLEKNQEIKTEYIQLDTSIYTTGYQHILYTTGISIYISAYIQTETSICTTGTSIYTTTSSIYTTGTRIYTTGTRIYTSD